MISNRIYNDVITLHHNSSYVPYQILITTPLTLMRRRYMTKLSLSHALAQSTKISLFEAKISQTIEETEDLPDTIESFGKIRGAFLPWCCYSVTHSVHSL